MKETIKSNSNLNSNNKGLNSNNQINIYEIYTYFITTNKNDLLKLTVKYSVSNDSYSILTDYLISPFLGKISTSSDITSSSALLAHPADHSSSSRNSSKQGPSSVLISISSS